MARGFLVFSDRFQSKTPEQRPRVMEQSTFQWLSLVWIEAAGVGAWGRTFQVWVGWFSWGT